EAEQQHAPRRALDDGMSRIAAAVRSTDLAGRLADGRVGVILLEQDDASAEAAQTRILERLGESGAVSWHPALFCYPRDGAAVSNLLTEGRAELQRRRQPA